MTHWRLLLQNDFLVIVLVLTLRRDLEVSKRDNVGSDSDPGQSKRLTSARIDKCGEVLHGARNSRVLSKNVEKRSYILIKHFNLFFFN